MKVLSPKAACSRASTSSMSETKPETMMAIEVSLGSDVTRDQLSTEADADIGAFETWFTKAVDTKKLHPAERAIIKTYLFWKVFRQLPRASKQ